MNDFNAEDARRISSDINTTENATQLDKILCDIKKLAESEKYELIMYKKIREAVKTELVNRGFKLNFHLATNQRDDSYTTITW